MTVDVLTVSTKGQVVLPAEMRKNLAIAAGTKLAAYASDDFIVLKVIQLPDSDEFREKLDEAQQWAESVGYTEDDVDEIVKSFRAAKRK